MVNTYREIEEQNIILAVSNPKEREELIELVAERELPYQIHCPESLKEFDTISQTHEISLIITDLDFQNGSLVDWLGLWPYPFIILANPGEEKKLDSVLSDETSMFLPRREDLKHVNFIPRMIKKVLSVGASRETQNEFIKVSERQYMNLVQVLPDIIYVLDSNGNFTFINNAVRNLGWEPVDLMGKHFSLLLFQDDIPKVSRDSILPNLRGKVTGNDRAPKLFDERRTGNRMTRGLRMRIKRKPTVGGAIDVSLTAYGEVSSIGYSGFQVEQYDGLGTAGVIREDRNISDISTSDRNAQSIFNVSGALTHNEVMHLLNNKLQILSSLVSLKQSLSEDPESSSSLNEVQIQIYTLSLVYQNMVTANNKVQIRMETYLEDIIKHLVSSYAGNPWMQQVNLHCDSVLLDEDPAITVSLFISEILILFLTLEEEIETQSPPVTITFLENNGIAQIKLKTSKDIFDAYHMLQKKEEPTLVIKTLVEILHGEVFLDEDSLTLFFNIEQPK